jgi:hypothetical protein
VTNRERATITLALAALLSWCGGARADDGRASAWRLTQVTTAARDGLTQFQVLQKDEHGGKVRVIRSPRDESCPTGATYILSWRIDGEARRVTHGSTLLVSFEGHQVGGGARCPNGEPLARAATGLGALTPDWGPGTFYSFEGPGYREFYLHPEEHEGRHLGQWRVTVPTNAYQQHLFLAIGIDASGNSGGQWFNFGLYYDAEQPGAPPLPASGGGFEPGMNRYGGDYRSFDMLRGRNEDCRNACAGEAQCRAFSIVRAGVQGAYPRCWLKSTVPPATPDPNTTSGVVRGGPAVAPQPAPSQPAPSQPRPAFTVNPDWLGTRYYKTSYYDTSYALTITAPNGQLDGRIRTTGARNDPRHLFHFRLVDNDTFDGEWESDPAFDNPATHQRVRMRGTFHAVYYASSGNTYYIVFKVAPGMEAPEGTELANSWYRDPY